jgi:hypothetical protein
MNKLEQIASYFQVELLPSGSPEEQRLAYLMNWAASAESVISNFPDVNDIDGNSVQSAVDIIGNEISTRGDAILQALQGNISKLSAAVAPPFFSKNVRDLVIGSFIAATAGITLHAPDTKAKLYALGKWTPADAETDYRHRLGIFQAIVKLASSGALDVLVPPPDEPMPVMQKGLVTGASAMTKAWIAKQRALDAQAQNGLGEPITLFTVVVVVVVAIVALAFLSAVIYYLWQYNKMMDVCLSRSDLPQWQQDICRDVANGPKDMFDSVIKYGALVVGLGLAVYFLPTIVGRVKKARQVARET